MYPGLTCGRGEAAGTFLAYAKPFTVSGCPRPVGRKGGAVGSVQTDAGTPCTYSRLADRAALFAAKGWLAGVGAWML